MAHKVPRTCLAPSAANGAASLIHLDSAAMATRRPESADLSPIDRAYRALRLASELSLSQENSWTPQHGLIYSAACVGAAEDYFRTVLTESVMACPRLKRRAESLETKMLFVMNGSLEDALRESIDRTSFSSRANVVAATETFIGTKLSRETRDKLDEFEIVCHVRHCAVHAGGYVAAHNAQVLKVPAGSWIAFQSPSSILRVVAVITASLRAFNQELFDHLLTKWIDEDLLKGDWATDSVLFRPLWGVFRSSVDVDSARAVGLEGFFPSAHAAWRSMRRSLAARAAAGG